MRHNPDGFLGEWLRPNTHDSTVSLSSLLPKIAHQRDEFYDQLLTQATGSRAERLRREAEQTQQPFGHIRQHLNLSLAKYGAKQVQHRHLAQLYAFMGYDEASRNQAAIIPSTSVRFETEILCRITSAHNFLERGEIEKAFPLVSEIEDLFKRGVGCGAIVDPWNILAFQGYFPLFTSREDSIPDQRIESLYNLVEQSFSVYAHADERIRHTGKKSPDLRLFRPVLSNRRKLGQFCNHCRGRIACNLGSQFLGVCKKCC